MHQFQSLGRAHALQAGAALSGRVDHALGATAERDQPKQRLKALLLQLQNDLPLQGEPARFVAADLWQTARWLRQALRAGAPYVESRAAALLQAVATLGALWFHDDRLLPPEQQLPAREDLQRTLAQLLQQPQAQRFRLAQRQAQVLRAGLHLKLRQALAPQATPEAMQALARQAFPAEPSDDGEDDGDAVLPPAAATDAAASSAMPAGAMARFFQREHALQLQAGITDPALQRTCLAGDLAFGLGRCARYLAAERSLRAQQPGQPPLDTATENRRLADVLDGLAR